MDGIPGDTNVSDLHDKSECILQALPWILALSGRRFSPLPQENRHGL